MGLACCFSNSKLPEKEKGHIWGNLGRDGMGWDGKGWEGKSSRREVKPGRPEAGQSRNVRSELQQGPP